MRLASLSLALALSAISCFSSTAAAQVVEHRLTAAEGSAADFFGQDVDLDGDWAIAGGPLNDELGNNSGAAYIFQRQSDRSWLEVDKLTASDGGDEHRFGQSVAISGGVVVVGAPQDGEVDVNSGACYVFERQGDGSWQETDKLTASDGAAQALFGFETSVQQSRVVITAPGDDDKGQRSGSAYVFERQNDGSWLEIDKLVASDGTDFDGLGDSVSLSGNRVLVGAKSQDGTGPADSGSAYIFERQGDGSWQEAHKLTASDGAVGDFFGIAVGLFGDYAIVGGSNASPLGNRSGAAWAFEQQADGSWIETDKILPSDGVMLDFFGFSVAVEGEFAAIGAYAVATDDTRGDGTLYAFARQSDGTWMEIDRLVGSDSENSQLGIALATSDGRVLGGADTWNGGRGAGYMFERVFPVAVEPLAGAPRGYELSSAYPNPFVGQTQFSLTVPTTQHVTVEVLDVLGRRAAVVHEALVPAAISWTITIDSGPLPSGAYVARVTGERFSASRTLTKLR